MIVAKAGDGLKADVSPRTLWGKVIIYLREHHAVALHIACGDITEVDMQNGVFNIYTTEDFLYELLQSEDNKQELKKALNNFGVQQFEIIKKDKKLPVAQFDLKILKEIFKDKLIIE